MLDIDSSGAENTQPIDEAIFLGLSGDLVTRAGQEGSDRDIFLTTVIRAIEMKGDRFGSFILNVPEMLTESVCKSSASLPDIRLFASLTDEGVDEVTGFTGESLPDVESAPRKAH